ncbi:uncharacterized protein A1O5_07748 [Cladophialophora psammophila CBS 110553]|uniref:Uncharacterized protein n=1 Tax=Cladophialophora psammophila CBS 110553 TaxID=1182543 RepID=W9WKZ6_9EURO|nr:uncharacterized protein A1O5_07748 [Cladophialophora psammophila CBS 110553]EXJ68817.1 hypothetical protein A1O5_07748 [Cladophialophora psammophila CBS 110553]
MAKVAEEIERRKLLRESNVFFDLNQSQAPGPEAYFQDIRALGGTNLDEYRANITIESDQKPWRQVILQHANFLSAKARRCLEQDKNEAGWRLLVEPAVIARFGIEVAW